MLILYGVTKNFQNIQSQKCEIMCEHGKTVKMPFCIRRNWNSPIGNTQFKEFDVDACIAYEVWKMNCLLGIVTLNSCCGHGRKLRDDEGEIMIDSHSVTNALKHGYSVKLVNRVWVWPDGTEYEAPTYEIKLARSIIP